MTMPDAPLRIAVIGNGFMGRMHTHAWRTAPRFFPLGREIVPVVLVGRRADGAAAARDLDWPEYATDWREVVGRADIDVVDICTPGDTHAEIALAALYRYGLGVDQDRDAAIEKRIAARTRIDNLAQRPDGANKASIMSYDDTTETAMEAALLGLKTMGERASWVAPLMYLIPIIPAAVCVHVIAPWRRQGREIRDAVADG